MGAHQLSELGNLSAIAVMSRSLTGCRENDHNAAQKLSLGLDSSAGRLRERSFKNGRPNAYETFGAALDVLEFTTCSAFHPASEPIHSTIRRQQASPRYVVVVRRCDCTANCLGKRRRVVAEDDHERAI